MKKKANLSNQSTKSKKTIESRASFQNGVIAKMLSWLDTNILLVLSGFLLMFIPLYPKLPLFDIIPGYIVRVRVEDIFIFLTTFIWLIQLYRGKAVWKTLLTNILIGYALVGALSTLSAVIITKTIPLDIWHIGKSLLHYLRYLEYFSLFFITYSATRTAKDARFLLHVMILTILGVSLYGFGQKYFYWPVYSTMNREFSKGIRLILDENARVQSTFGGHYDLGAYLVITLPLLMAAVYSSKEKISTFVYGSTLVSGMLLLVLDASRSSFGGFILASIIVTLLYALQQKTTKQKAIWFFTRYSLFILIIGVQSVYFGQSISERLLQTLQGYPVLNTAYHTFNAQRKEFMYETLPELNGMSDSVDNLFKVEKPANSITTSQAEVLIASDTQPVPADKPVDVYVDVPAPTEVATISATGEETTIIVYKERTYSDNAKLHGLSYAIRLDTLWPRAIEGFKKNPLLGSGYATLTKESLDQFTEAESTDNNFLRTLGETGLLGFITFYGTIVIMLKESFKHILSKRNNSSSFMLASIMIAASIGLLFNAIYIDVFAASKVAFTYWGLVGITLATLHQQNLEPIEKSKGISSVRKKHV